MLAPEDVAEVWELLAQVSVPPPWSKPDSGVTPEQCAAAWVSIMPDVSPGELRAMVAAWCRRPSPFWPQPGQLLAIRSEALEAIDDTADADAGWGMVLSAIRSCGYRRLPVPPDRWVVRNSNGKPGPVKAQTARYVHQALEVVGGWDEVVAGLVGEPEYVEAFCAVAGPELPHLAKRKLETHGGILWDALKREREERGRAKPVDSSWLLSGSEVFCFSLDPEEHRRVALCVERMGGWSKVCRMTRDSEMADRASFRAMYRTIGERQAKRQEFAAVAALADVSSRPMLGATRAPVLTLVSGAGREDGARETGRESLQGGE